MIDELIIFLKMTWDCGACTLMATVTRLFDRWLLIAEHLRTMPTEEITLDVANIFVRIFWLLLTRLSLRAQ